MGSANGDDPEFFNWTFRALSLAGAGGVTLAATVFPKAKIAVARAVISSADVVFLGGGEVDNGMNALKRCGIDDLLVTLCRQGKPFIGLSAGSIMLGRQWIRWPNENDLSRFELFSCLGCAPVICDTHAEGEGWVELKALLRAGGHGVHGYGIPAGGCLVVESDGRCAALGKPVLEFTNVHGSVRRFGAVAPS